MDADLERRFGVSADSTVMQRLRLPQLKASPLSASAASVRGSRKRWHAVPSAASP